MGIVAFQVLEGLQTRLEVITKANGYRTDAGSLVFLGREQVRPNEAPALSIMEGEDAFEVQLNGPAVTELGNYLIRGVCEADPDHPLKAGHELLADIKQALMQAERSEKERLPGVELRLRYTGRQVYQREMGEKFCLVDVFVEIEHFEKYGDPTTSPNGGIQ